MKLYTAQMTDRKQSRLLLHKALFRYTGIDNWKIGTEPLGKPFAIPPVSSAPDVHFSLSHSGTFWIIALDDHPLGLDIQQHKGPCTLSLAKRYFHPEEIAFWQKNGEKSDVFYDIWCAKESYVKYTGEGITRNLAGFSVFHPPVPLQRIPFAGGYSVYLCSEHLPDVLPDIGEIHCDL
ncbi:MAG: 4'-phosphopantetheinyl transferase superfamily protein [Clostridia bacterium]|nr:4'-phosphopantetheinyl transferase superfamily protein [Clostridia bacterium]